MKNFPYNIIPDIQALPGSSGEERTRHIRRIAAAVGDPAALRTILGIDPQDFNAFYPDMLKTTLSTEDTIDSFISRYQQHGSAPQPAEPAEPAIPLDEAPYDISELEAADALDMENDSTSSLIDSFLSEMPAKKPARKAAPKASEKAPAPKPSAAAQAAPLSESLARVMIKNGNYAKALEIISNLSLNNPKKSVYFADQIRFIKKLILNQSKMQEAKRSSVTP